MYESFSRRSYNSRCRYWKVDKNDTRNLQNLVRENKADGVFFAREAEETHRTEVEESGILEIDHQVAVIESPDDLSKLEHKDLVEYLGQIWIVDNIQSKIINKTTEYYTRSVKIWWVTLRNGE